MKVPGSTLRGTLSKQLHLKIKSKLLLLLLSKNCIQIHGEKSYFYQTLNGERMQCHRLGISGVRYLAVNAQKIQIDRHYMSG